MSHCSHHWLKVNKLSYFWFNALKWTPHNHSVNIFIRRGDPFGSWLWLCVWDWISIEASGWIFASSTYWTTRDISTKRAPFEYKTSKFNHFFFLFLAECGILLIRTNEVSKRKIFSFDRHWILTSIFPIKFPGHKRADGLTESGSFTFMQYTATAHFRSIDTATSDTFLIDIAWFWFTGHRSSTDSYSGTCNHE